MSDAEGRERGRRGSRRSAWAVRLGMGLALVIISLAGWGGGMPPSGVLAGPNDPPDVNATVASTDPNAPHEVEPTPTFQSEAPVDTPTPWIPEGQEPGDDATEEPPPVPDNPLPAPPEPAPTAIEVAPDIHLPDVSVPTVPMISATVAAPKLMPAVLHVTGLVCPRTAFDIVMDSRWTRCTPTAPLTFGVTIARPSPATSASRSLAVPAGGVGEAVVNAPATITIHLLTSGYGYHQLDCTAGDGSWIEKPDAGIAVGPGEEVDCAWYAVEWDDDIIIDGSVTVCAANPALAPSAPKPSKETLATLCTDWPDSFPGVRIDLKNAAGTITRTWEMAAMPWPADTIAGYGVPITYWVFYDLPPGTYTLTFTVPAGYDRAFVGSCGKRTGGGMYDAVSAIPVSGSGTSFTVTATSGGAIDTCDWYLVRSS